MYTFTDLTVNLSRTVHHCIVFQQSGVRVSASLTVFNLSRYLLWISMFLVLIDWACVFTCLAKSAQFLIFLLLSYILHMFKLADVFDMGCLFLSVKYWNLWVYVFNFIEVPNIPDCIFCWLWGTAKTFCIGIFGLHDWFSLITMWVGFTVWNIEVNVVKSIGSFE